MAERPTPCPAGSRLPSTAEGRARASTTEAATAATTATSRTPTRSPNGSGAGGGGGSYGGLGLNGDTACTNAGASGSLRGSFYGDAAIGALVGGSGGGGGGNAALIATPAVPFPNLGSHSGGGGGAGGGAMLVQAQSFTLDVGGRILLNGATGGLGGGPMGGSGGNGGGGSGGALKVQALSVALSPTGLLQAIGGPGAGGMPAGMGASGLEDSDGMIANTSVANPAPSVGEFGTANGGWTVAQSRFYDSGTANPAWGFDGSNPGSGVASARSTQDLIYRQPPHTGQSVRITFQGAPPDPLNPNQPDPNGMNWLPPQLNPATGAVFATDIATLSRRNFRFIRFRVEFDVGRSEQGVGTRRGS